MPFPYQCVCSASGFGADELSVSEVPQFEVREGVPYLSPEYAKKAWDRLARMRWLPAFEADGPEPHFGVALTERIYLEEAASDPRLAHYVADQPAADVLSQVQKDGGVVAVPVSLADPSYRGPCGAGPNPADEPIDCMFASSPAGVESVSDSMRMEAYDCALFALLPPRGALASVSPMLLASGVVVAGGLAYWYFNRK